MISSRASLDRVDMAETGLHICVKDHMCEKEGRICARFRSDMEKTGRVYGVETIAKRNKGRALR